MWNRLQRPEPQLVALKDYELELLRKNEREREGVRRIDNQCVQKTDLHAHQIRVNVKSPNRLV
jgi:hypothetical protein